MSEIKNTAPKPRGPAGGGPMGGGPGMMMGAVGPKAKDFGGSIKKLVGYLGKYKWTIIIVWILAIVSTVFMILGPKILGTATDELFTGIMSKIAGTGNVDFDKIGGILLWLVGLYLISALFSYLQGYVMSAVSMKVTYRLRFDINEKIHRLPFQYFDKTTHGEVLSRITNDVDTISQTLNQSLTQIITSVTALIGIVIMMFTISWQLTLVSLVTLPLSMVFIMMIIKKSKTHFANQQKFLGNVNGHVEEMFGSYVVVKAFNGQEESEKKFAESNDSLYQSAWKANFLSGLMMPITTFIGNLTYVAICILGGYLATTGKMTVGGIQAFIQYVRSFTQPIAQLANISNVLQQTAAASERVFEFLGEKEEVTEDAGALSVNRGADVPDTDTLVHIDSEVEFDHASFGYAPDKIIIRDFSARVKPGQKIAIVGPTGAGKTTIVKILMRFYDVNSGAITIDGHDIKLFKRNELRSLFGMVLQDTWLFNGTIADNIRYGRLGATDEDVRKAAVAAQVDHFIHTLPDGYNMVLNEEADNISQGQKQLLTIARAILANPEMLILDEATSSVDTRTEVLIQKAMDNLMKGRTSFVIAHRLSTIRNADLILVMNDGDIVEQGSHDELIAKDGFYANLYNSQFEKVNAGA
jgi:ATP-binding cassette subfamily B protein